MKSRKISLLVGIGSGILAILFFKIDGMFACAVFATISVISFYASYYDGNLEKELENKEIEKANFINSIKTGTHKFPVDKFYKDCISMGVTDLSDAFYQKKAVILVHEYFRSIFAERSMYKVDESLYAEHYTNKVQNLFLQGKTNSLRGKRQEEKKMERAKTSVTEGKIESSDIDVYEFNKKFINCSADNKSRKILYDKLRINEIADKINAIKKGYIASMEVAAIMNSSAYTEKGMDWATAGGIASGIAGPGAGIAVAADTMRRNSEIERSNELNRMRVQNTSSSIAGAATKKLAELPKLEKELARCEEKLTECEHKVVSTEYDKKELFNSLKCVCKPSDITPKASSMRISIHVKNTFKSPFPEGVVAAIDGSLYAIIKADNGKQIDTVPVVLPLYGIECGGSCLLTGVTDKYLSGEHSYFVEVIPKNLWVTEV